MTTSQERDKVFQKLTSRCFTSSWYIRMRRMPIDNKIPEQMKIGRKVRLSCTHCPACSASPLKNTTKSPLNTNRLKTNKNFFFEKVNAKARLKIKENA